MDAIGDMFALAQTVSSEPMELLLSDGLTTTKYEAIAAVHGLLVTVKVMVTVLPASPATGM